MYASCGRRRHSSNTFPARDPSPAHQRSRRSSQLESSHTMTASSAPSGAATPALSVPPAQVHFPPRTGPRSCAASTRRWRPGQLTLGAIGRELEERFAAHHGAKHAVAVNSGTSAIEIPLRALAALGQPVDGREVLVPANTFFATAAAVVAAGARPQFVDCDPATMAVDPSRRRAPRSDRDTAGLVVVHIGGLVTPADPRAARAVRRARHLPVRGRRARARLVARRSHGRHVRRRRVVQLLPDQGHGRRRGRHHRHRRRHDRRRSARIYRDQGKASFTANVHTHLGYNWRMSEPHAAIALSQLGRLDEFIAHRQRIAKIYDDGLGDLPLTPLAIPTDAVVQLLQVRRLPARRRRPRRAQADCCARSTASACPARCTSCRCNQQPVFEPWVDAPAARRRAAVRVPHLPARVGSHDRRAGRASSSSSLRAALDRLAAHLVAKDPRCPEPSPSPEGPASSARTSSTRCSTPAAPSACSTRSRRTAPTPNGCRSTCSTPTASPPRSPAPT